ncbi:MAG TPA: 5-oxoprolinase/urea amidolyase family protein [Acidocella sp.]|jgi:urea carboxylase|uniref:5-oxoprolinase/urea amidolyase family protein n=1 Tax=Acidocella sp. TaxID=50710 RepID=UPI002D11A974|nr:5-oxoprolinase/urea amidolyase family protein [Acidocella sp.]HVE23627.1 5-oxoprolinase/urea amidolyase family protein [Acidocella sp.]
MFSKVLIANRGEILRRVCRTLDRMGVAAVAVYSEADKFAPAVLAAPEAVAIGPAPAAESYLNIDAIIAACQKTGAQAVHPGYGFLSERVEFAERLAAAGLKFIGPAPAHLRDFGLKHTARALAAEAGVPMLPGSGLLPDVAAALREAERITYPVMLKSSAGGGGIGMVLCNDAAELAAKFASVARLAVNNFGNAALFLEKYVARARHVEVQIFGDGKGNVVSLGTRDCSLQRRNQKVIEETPAPGIPLPTLQALEAAAVALAKSVSYESAGTVEFVYDAETRQFYFLEVNTRLQVEHGVTEAVYGVDLVEWMVRQAAGEFALPAQEDLVAKGAAVEARIYAEIPSENFRPASGTIIQYTPPQGLRVDGWVETGTEISSYYDPMLAKFIATGATRAEAIAALRAGLAEAEISGIETNADYCREILALPEFSTGEMTTRTLSRFEYVPKTISVLDGGAQSSLQSLPGRLGFWEVGIPPSGPMDDKSFVAANLLLGNAPGETALELTLIGPTLKFAHAVTIALTGAVMEVSLDNVAVPYNRPVQVRAGQVLALGSIAGPGQRAYLAVAGGFAAPEYLGSTATFTLGGFGGHSGAALRAGDTLRLKAPDAAVVSTTPELAVLTHEWELQVRNGPHQAPDFFKPSDIETLFSSSYEVHHNSARTGIRLIGPKPKWARADGGEAGLHPSNIHDNAYAVGAIDFTGDMPILLGPDGPSLGGFVCPAVVTKEDLWKLGQLKPGDKVRFVAADVSPAVIATQGDVVIRQAGDEDILIEFGEMMLDFELRLRAQALRDALAREAIPGIVDLTPGIRSLQIHFDIAHTSRAAVMAAVERILPTLPAPGEMVLKSRILHLPLSWNDPQIQLAMRKYQETTRPDAPWCPDNIEFIRRINGLASLDDVKRIVFDASYVVMGLGDVYLGAPVATPYDPRHRLVTTKYNPARPWTPQNAVGIGGAYMCIYGMEGPGGYQLFGRTIQVWNTHRETPPFAPGHPWLLRHFDQIRFFEVSTEELALAREQFLHGKYEIRIEETEFSLGAYKAFCAENAESIAAFQQVQRAAFAAERADWAAKGLNSFEEKEVAPPPEETPLGAGARAVGAPVPGSVWQILVKPGDQVQAGDTLMLLESMKMEVRVVAAASGTIQSITAEPGQAVRAGQRLGVVAL